MPQRHQTIASPKEASGVAPGRVSHNEYLFALENILQQISTLDKDLKRKKWYTRTDKDIVIRKGLIIFKNLNELALSIAKNDHESIKDISQSILSYDKLSFNITNKLVS